MGIGIRAFIQWQSPGARTLGFLMLSMAIWAGFYLLEILHPSLPVKVFARKLVFLGMTMSPPFWLGFALRYTGLEIWWARSRRIFLLAIPGVIAFLFGATNESHHLIWVSHSLSNGPIAPLTIEYGPGFWVSTFIAYGLITLGFTIYIFSYFQSARPFRIKTGIMLVGAFLTLAVNVGFLFWNNNLNLDPTPLSFALSAPLIAFGYFRFGVSNLFPLASSLVMENLQDAILVVDQADMVTDLNLAAMELLGLGSITKKTPVFSVLPQAERIKEIWDSPDKNMHLEINTNHEARTYKVKVMPIRPTGEILIGHVIIIHDITTEQSLLKAEKRRSKQLSLLEETGRHIAGSFEENDILKRTVDEIIHQFGYPMAAISLLNAENMLEIVAISATEDFGYQTGYKQEYGSGIIGYTASLKKTYVAKNVSKDIHYYSTSTRSGSAICTPIFMRDVVYGTLYIESYELNAFDDLDVVTLETLATQVSESLMRASLYARTQNDLLTLTTIQNISKLIVSSLDMATISRTVVQNLKEAFQYTHVSIYFLNEDYLHLMAQVGYQEELVLNKIHISQGVTGKTVRTRKVQFIEDTSKEDIFLQADEHLKSEICIPLLKEDIVLGVLNVESSRQNRLTLSDVNLLTTIAGPIALAMDNARLHAELKQMATTDAVTGLSNRHVFERALQAEFERAGRNGTPLSLIVFDIDFFKEYNDKWGHPAGDARLKAIADIIKHTLRKYDIAARYGGDEFAIILSDCTTQHALTFAKRLCLGAREGAIEPIEDGVGLSGHTLSLGIATFPQDAALPSELLIAADHAAMRAKQQGRNRIKFANDYEQT
jgi:diguanylate cyclase (GGDEF)-like protein